MPIPKPEGGETESQFVSRCISKIIDEYDQSQAAAICYNTYRKKEEMSKKENIFVLQPRKSENRGKYLSRCGNNSKMKTQFPVMKERLGFCLNSFNEYYRYWNKLEFSEVPEDSALGLCIATKKAQGFDYKEAYARCASKVVVPSGTISLNEDNLLIEPVEFQDCPPATLDIPLNLENRQKCIDQANYGPLDPNLPNEDYWKEKADRFNTKPDEAKKALCGNCVFFIKTPEMLDCIASGLGDIGVDPYDSIKAGDLGYCEAYDFKCAASRTCDAWVVGGPITE
jgi:hypothetical protein